MRPDPNKAAPLNADAWRQLAHKVIGANTLFPVLALLVSGGLWLGTLMMARVDVQANRDAALALTRELTETYEAQVLRVLREIEQDFNIIQYAYEHQPADQVLSELSTRELLPPTLLFNIAVINAEGTPLSGSAPLASPLAPTALANHRDTTALVIEADAADSQLLQFRRSLFDLGGSFLGVAVIEADAAFFTSSYDEQRLGKQGLLALVGTDGQIKVRRVGDEVVIGEAIDYPRFAQDLVNEFETLALLRPSLIDGVHRYVAARALFGFPLTVSVGLSEQELYAPVRARTQGYLGRAALANVALLLVIGLLWRLSYQLAQSRRLEMETKIAHAEQIEYLAYHDGLTGLPNRSLFSKLLSQNLALAARERKRLALLFLDLDHFKYINDTLGHDAGDDLLREVARRLTGALRESDVVARLGGDEFVVLLPGVTTPEESAGVAQKIIQAVARPYRLAGQDFSVTASVGISAYPDDGRDEETLTKHADIAMYKAKQEGKNTFQLYSANLHAESLERLALESNLRHALAQQQFTLYFQAKRDLKDGTLLGLEALLRWQHPEMGLVAPSRFLQVAEEMGLLVAIGRWMLNQACQQHKQWQLLSGRPLNIAVPLWKPMFFSSHLLADIQSALAQADLSPVCLELEVSESILMENIDKSIEILGALKSLGVRIALGNFGVGYSCMGTLRNLPVDVIKIDRSFIRNLDQDWNDRERAEAICTLGKSLGMTLVADGVETDQQMHYLQTNSGRCIQGFYRNAPLSAETLAQLLGSAAQEANQRP